MYIHICIYNVYARLHMSTFKTSVVLNLALCSAVAIALVTNALDAPGGLWLTSCPTLVTWTPEVRKVIAFWDIVEGFGPLFYILLGSR